MTLPPPTPSQLAQWGEDRRPTLYGSLIVLLIINNLVAGGRFVAHWRAHYRREFSFRTIFAEDYFILLGALCIDVVVANLLAGLCNF
jgi:membrane protein required for beta-lactamase induction